VDPCGCFGDEKNLLPWPGYEPRLSSPHPGHYTDWAVPLPKVAIISEHQTGKDVEETDHGLI